MIKVLIAEDDNFLTDAYKTRLSQSGIGVDTAIDGVEALTKLRGKESYDLLILDLVMPRVDGYKVLEAMKSEGIKLPILVVTNLGQADDFKRAKEFGVNEYIVKTDVTLDDLVKKIKKLAA